MNRRSFTASLAAAFAMPALPAMATTAATAGAAAPVVVASIPTQARFWAIYMNGMHGTCTPGALQAMLNIPAAQAQGYLRDLVTQGVIKPTPALARIKAASDKSSNIWDRLKTLLDDPKTDVTPDADDPIDTGPEDTA